MWIRIGWSTSDGTKELIPVAFAASAVTVIEVAMFRCTALASNLPCNLTLLEERYAFMSRIAVLCGERFALGNHRDLDCN